MTGELVDIRFVEVKTREAVPSFELADTKNNGSQLSERWTRNNLYRIIHEHPDANARRFASEVFEQMMTRPEIVHRELHGIAVKSNKYVVKTADDTGEITSIAAEGRLTRHLEWLSIRGISEETRALARRHLSKFNEFQTTSAGAGAESRASTSQQVSLSGTPGLSSVEAGVGMWLMVDSTFSLAEDIRALNANGLDPIMELQLAKDSTLLGSGTLLMASGIGRGLGAAEGSWVTASATWGGRLGIAGIVLVEGVVFTQWMTGNIDDRTFTLSTAALGGGVAGGFAGGWIGGTIGSFIVPGFGTAIGGVVGAIAGSWFGSEGAVRGTESLLGPAGNDEERKLPEEEERKLRDSVCRYYNISQ